MSKAELFQNLFWIHKYYTYQYLTATSNLVFAMLRLELCSKTLDIVFRYTYQNVLYNFVYWRCSLSLNRCEEDTNWSIIVLSCVTRILLTKTFWMHLWVRERPINDTDSPTLDGILTCHLKHQLVLLQLNPRNFSFFNELFFALMLKLP